MGENALKGLVLTHNMFEKSDLIRIAQAQQLEVKLKCKHLAMPILDYTRHFGNLANHPLITGLNT